MRIFDKPNKSNSWKCPICKTNDNKPVVLVSVEGTQEGNNVEAEQIHLECIDLTYYKDIDILVMGF